jgi:opacity protein-like surface antigen
MARRTTWLATAFLVGLSVSAEAQDPRAVYAGLSIGTHVERGERVTGRAPAIGIVGGVRFNRSWGVEVELAWPTRSFVRERTCRCVSLASTLEDFDRLAVTERLREVRTVTSSVSVGAVYQPQLGQWRPRVFMGVTNHRVSEDSTSTILAVPEGVDPARVAAMHPDSHVARNLGGLAVGGGVVYSYTPHLSLGADVRYDYGSIGDEINNVWRSSVRSIWSF